MNSSDSSLSGITTVSGSMEQVINLRTGRVMATNVRFEKHSRPFTNAKLSLPDLEAFATAETGGNYEIWTTDAEVTYVPMGSWLAVFSVRLMKDGVKGEVFMNEYDHLPVIGCQP